MKHESAFIKCKNTNTEIMHFFFLLFSSHLCLNCTIYTEMISTELLSLKIISSIHIWLISPLSTEGHKTGWLFQIVPLVMTPSGYWEFDKAPNIHFG